MIRMFRGGEKRPSMRFVVILTIGTALLFFMALFSYIFVNNMFEMLERNETDQILTKSDIVISAVNNSMMTSRAFTADWASWDETYEFAKGRNPDHFAKYWTEDWKIRGQKYNFLVVKDLSGKDLYVKGYDYFEQQRIPLPEGFSEFLTTLAGDMQKDFQGLRDHAIFRPSDRDGFVIYNDNAYYICARPILTYDEKSDSAGSLFFGRSFNSREIERITSAADLNFSILEISSEEVQNLGTKINSDGPIVKTKEETIILYTLLPGFLKNSNVVLKIEKNRDLYKNGLKIIQLSCMALGIVMLCFIGVVFWLLEKYILHPIERISNNVLAVSDASACIIADDYNDSKELYALAESINLMLNHLALNQELVMQSTVSMNILQNILNSLDTYLFVLDIETQSVLFINDKMKTHFKLEDDVIGRPCYEVITPCMEKSCQRCPRPKLIKNSNEPVISEEQVNITGRHYRRVDMVIDWVEGKKAHLQYFIDITGIKQAEAALKKSLQQEKLMSSISRNFITKGDMETFINNTLEMTGKFMNIDRIILTKHNKESRELELSYVWNPLDVGVGKTGDRFSSKELRGVYDELEKNNYEPIVFNGTNEEQSRFEHAKSKKIMAFLAIPLHVSEEFWGILVFDQCEFAYTWSESDINLGKLIGNVLSSALTHQNAERQLLHMSALINSAPQYISYIDLTGKYEFFNPATYEITGYSYEELMAGGITILYEDETNKYVSDEIIPQIEKLGKYEFELELIRKDGERRIMSFSAFTIDSDKKKCGCIAIDITEKKRLEKNLMEAKESAEKASRAKGEFLSRMSHEMRTPMNAIIGMTQIAKTADNTEKKEYCLEKIGDASKHLLGVINDILDMSKIEADKFELSYSEFDLEKMLINAVAMINFRAEEKKQTLIVNLDKNSPQFIIEDEQRLAQVITNLLSNAVKFTPNNGKITLNVNKLGEENGEHILQFEIEDSGIGISPEQQARLFKSFEQADGSIAREYGGTGLGLAISKRIVELMGGAIRVESELGRGSKFIFTIKAQTGIAKPRALFPSGINKENLHILAVDDSPETREYFTHVMRPFGLSCDIAKDGMEALKMIIARQNKPYNMFFIDYMMPGMNGIELTRRIKEIAKDNAIVVMISVAEWNEIEHEATLAGVDRFISKPLFPSVLINSINECLGLPPQDKAARKSPTENNFKDHTVLLVEDIEINREIVAAFLERTGITVDFAENGLEALEVLKKYPDKYSLILMDVHMPEMDGYETTRSIRSFNTEKAKKIPIIAMTANVYREDVQQCLEAGMDDHIGKPVNIEELFAKLNKYLPKKNTPGVAGAKNADYKPIEFDTKLNLSSAPDYSKFLPHIDVTEGLKRVMNNKTLYFTLLKNFKCRQMTDELIQSIRQSDFEKTAQTAHALRGAASNLGFVQLTNITKNIEAQAKLKSIIEQFTTPLDEAANAAIISINTLLESEGIK